MRRAIVTGTSRGIGRAVTEMLLSDGWWVIGVARTDAEIDHPHYNWMLTDVSDFSLDGALGTVDALVHCAGIRGPYGPFEDVDPDAWEQTITTNLLGTARVVRACLPALRRSEDGRILLMSGGGAFDPSPGFSAYAASKAGTVALMETLAAELKDTSVTVNAVAPGFVKTAIHAGTPQEHMTAEPDALELAVDCVRHLLSPATRGLTGRTISARWDDWSALHPLNVERVNASPMGTRTRHVLTLVDSLIAQIPRRRVLV